MGMNVVLQGPNGEQIRVNPARDIANYWGQLTAAALQHMDDQANWPADLKPLLIEAGVTSEEVVQAALAYTNAMRTAYQRDYNSPMQGLQECGWFNLRPIVRTLVCYRLGQVNTGAWWDGIRDVTAVDTVPACEEDLIKTGLQLAAACNKEIAAAAA